MKLLADESVDRQIVDRLRLDGHDVKYVAELAAGASDEVVLDHAHREHALLVTADKDFGELVHRQRRVSGGVLLLRLAGVIPGRKAEIVADLVREHAEDLVGSFAVVTPGTARSLGRADRLAALAATPNRRRLPGVAFLPTNRWRVVRWPIARELVRFERMSAATA